MTKVWRWMYYNVRIVVQNWKMMMNYACILAKTIRRNQFLLVDPNANSGVMVMAGIEETRFSKLRHNYCNLLFQLVYTGYNLVSGPAQVVIFCFCYDYYPRFFTLLERYSTFLLFQNHPT